MNGEGGAASGGSSLPGTGASTALVSSWAADLALPAFRPMSRDEIHTFLTDAANRLVSAAAADPPDLETARGVGSSLVEADFVASGVLPATVAALGRHLAAAVREAGACDPGLAAPAVQAAVADGYLTRLRARILHEQETVRRAEVDARRHTEQALRSSEARFRAIFANAGIGIGIAELDGRIVDANAAFAEMLGYSVEEFCRLRVDDFVYPEDAEGMWDLYREMIEGKRDGARVEKRYRHRDGHIIWTNLVASLIRDAHGVPRYTVAMAEDVTARRELQERLRRQALHDPLTQLPNRTLFQDRLSALFERSGSRVGICYLDLDRFKAVNDRLGHDIGDRLLQGVAERLDETVSTRGHLVARMGGDEFVVLVEDPPDGELALLAESILAALAEPVDIDQHRLVTSASIGVIECAVADTTPADLLRSADLTLYWAKSEGRNRWMCFDPERSARDMTRYTVSATLLPGLERDEFRVEYQPIIGMDDERPRGVEALVRWAHPELGRLGPDQFIELAEENGAIVPLGRRVLTEACERVSGWNATHPDAELYVSVNLAVRQAHDRDLVDDVSRVLEESGLPPRLLQLELTESALLGPAGRPVEAITALARMGVRIAVDDFGTGYSNLGYLPRLPLHTLKIAGVLVHGLSSGTADAAASGATAGAEAIVSSMIVLAHSLGLEVTAEGVETPTQATRLREDGCDSAQGWLYARAMPWEELAGTLETAPLPVGAAPRRRGGVP